MELDVCNVSSCRRFGATISATRTDGWTYGTSTVLVSIDALGVGKEFFHWLWGAGSYEQECTILQRTASSASKGTATNS